MASRLLLRRLRTLTNPTRHPVTSGNSSSPFKLQALLVHQRRYADVASPAPAAPPPPPPALDSENPPPNAKKVVQKSGSLNEAELAKFAAMADQWWEAEGPFKALHAMNPTRVAFLRSTLCRHFGKDPSSTRPLQGLKIVDVGCGGGILSEPLARLGADVTGIDAVEKNIKIARLHAIVCGTLDGYIAKFKTFAGFGSGNFSN